MEDYAITLVVRKWDERFTLEAKPVHDKLHIDGAHGDLGSIICSVIGYHTIARGKIKLETRGLSPMQMDSLESVVGMHNQLEDIKEILKS